MGSKRGSVNPKGNAATRHNWKAVSGSGDMMIRRRRRRNMPQQEEIMTAEEKINSHVIKFAILDNTLL